jgi:cytochrome c553
MTRSWLLCVIAPLIVGCGNDRGFDPGDPGEVDGGDGGGGHPAEHRGLPCDVTAILADHCQGCHGSTPSNGAPISLVSYADLTVRNPAGVMVADRALARMKSPGAQMPPAPATAVPSADVASIAAWVNAGVPAADCTAAPGPFDGPPVCTSGMTWTGGNAESPLMHPGGACITCHLRSGDAAPRSGGAPRFAVGGTVYPTGHEPTDCFGATSATVEVSDASGHVTALPVNPAGNFFTSVVIPFPIHVAVVAGGKRRSMSASPPSGDCNSCHTQDGANGAPGRIALP